MEVSISSHEAEAKDIKKDMQNGKILHISDNLPLSSEWSLTKAPVKPEGPDLVPSSDIVSSDGKVNTLSADKQTDGAESSEPYTITPDTYTNKKGKTTDVSLVTFNRELTAEEKAEVEKSNPENAVSETEQERDPLLDEVRQWLDTKGMAADDSSRSAVMRHFKIGYVRAGKILNDIAEYKSVTPKEDSDMVGRSLTEQEATDLIERMEANAEVAPAVELTPENWIAQFGEDGTVETPVGVVKMGANQLLKL